MKIRSRFVILNVFLLIGLSLLWLISPQTNYWHISAQSNSQTISVIDATREEAYRANNLGVALLEQFEYKKAVELFRRALEIDPNLKLARINLAIALYNLPDYEAALNEARTAAEIAPESPQPAYILGLIARTQNRTEDAIAFFKRVLEKAPNDVGANVNLGQIYMQQRKYTEAVAIFRAAFEAEPYNSTALYNLATSLLREGNREEGQKLMLQFQTLRQSGAATSIGQNYLEQGRFAEAVASTGAESELIDRRAPAVNFVDATDQFFRPTATAQEKNAQTKSIKASPVENNLRGGQKPGFIAEAGTLFDYDSDGDLDLAVSARGKIILYRNENGQFIDVTDTAGDLVVDLKLAASGIVAGDFDNDLKIDLLARRRDGFTLYRNAGEGRFTDVTKSAALPVPGAANKTQQFFSAFAFVDVDHDGDLDIFAAGGDASVGEKQTEATQTLNKLLRNNGNSTFTDISETARISDKIAASVVIPTDYDNRRDTDLLVVGERKTAFYRNQRDGSFKEIASEVGLDAGGKSAAAGDVNKDGFTDFFIGRADGESVLYLSDGNGRFKKKKIATAKIFASASQFLDYDNDGLLDLVVSDASGFRVWRNLGNDWQEGGVFAKSPNGNFVSGDIDRDGDLDVVVLAENAPLKILRNDGGNLNNSFALSLQGRVSNRTGIGAKIDMRAGSLTQKLETYAASPAPAPAEIHFGLGKREKPDAVRVIWTSGTVQAEIEFPAAPKNQIAFQPLKIEELDRKPSSCPYLYAWNGEKFEFITDFLGGGEMAYSFGDGKFNTPDSDEYVRITSEQLKPRDGRYELRVTNELEEVLYLDRFQLVAVDHAQNTEIYPNEGAGIPTAEKFILYTTRGEKPVLKAIDGFGNDVTESVRKMDRNFYDTFQSEKIRGFAKPHEIVLTLDEKKGYNGKTLLLMTGWTDYAFSSDNVAAAQAGIALQPPKLQVKNKKGKWETVIESAGFSVGRPQTVVVDLTGKFLSKSREVRILTNMKTLWDKIAVDTSSDESGKLRISKIEPQIADLRERGFSLEIKPDGKEPILVDYDTVLNDSRWKYFSGSFTRTGNVLPLLQEPDDVFLISKTGDELVLSFDENDLPPLEKGKKRTFLLYSVGYSKEMDINSASPDQVLPLPFRQMKKYPYGADEQFPMTEEKRRIYDEYTTRRVKVAVPRIESALLK